MSRYDDWDDRDNRVFKNGSVNRASFKTWRELLEAIAKAEKLNHDINASQQIITSENDPPDPSIISSYSIGTLCFCDPNPQNVYQSQKVGNTVSWVKQFSLQGATGSVGLYFQEYSVSNPVFPIPDSIIQQQNWLPAQKDIQNLLMVEITQATNGFAQTCFYLWNITNQKWVFQGNTNTALNGFSVTDANLADPEPVGDGLKQHSQALTLTTNNPAQKTIDAGNIVTWDGLTPIFQPDAPTNPEVGQGWVQNTGLWQVAVWDGSQWEVKGSLSDGKNATSADLKTILGNGTKSDPLRVGISSDPNNLLGIDDTGLVALAQLDKIADGIYAVGSLYFSVNQFNAPKAGSWVKWTFGSKVDANKYPLLAAALPEGGLLYGADGSFPKLGTNGGWDSSGDAMRHLTGSLATVAGTYVQSANGCIVTSGSNGWVYNATNNNSPAGLLMGFDNANQVAIDDQLHPQNIGMSFWVKADPETNPMSLEVNRSFKTIKGFLYNPFTFKVVEHDHPVQDGVSLSKYFTEKMPPLNLAVEPNTTQIIEDGKWKTVPDYRSTQKNPARSFDGTKVWVTYKVGEELPKGFTVVPMPSYNPVYETVHFDPSSNEWIVTKDANKLGVCAANDFVQRYKQSYDMAVMLNKKPTAMAQIYFEKQWEITQNTAQQNALLNSSNKIEFDILPPVGDCSPDNPNWFN